MKRGGPDHPKTFALAEALGVRRPYAVGLLEMLFHFTAEYAPEGDVGRYADKRIAAALDWAGNASKLMEAMISTGWIDRHPTFRLVVHDWGDHADRVTRQRLVRRGKIAIGDGGGMPTETELQGSGLPAERELHPSDTLATGKRLASDWQATGKLPQSTSEQNQELSIESVYQEKSHMTPPPIPYPIPIPKPIPLRGEGGAVALTGQAALALSEYKHDPAEFRDWIRVWPQVPDEGKVCGAWKTFVTCRDDVTGAFASRDRYLASRQVSDGYVMNADRFLIEQKSNNWRGKWSSRRTANNGSTPDKNQRRREEVNMGLKALDEIRKRG